MTLSRMPNGFLTRSSALASTSLSTRGLRVFARLGEGFGWTVVDEQGARSPVVLADVHRYAGMVTGKAAHDGRLWSRPLGEFEALSIDGFEWKPFFELRGMIPWEGAYVPEQVVPLPLAG